MKCISYIFHSYYLQLCTFTQAYEGRVQILGKDLQTPFSAYLWCEHGRNCGSRIPGQENYCLAASTRGLQRWLDVSPAFVCFLLLWMACSAEHLSNPTWVGAHVRL